MTHFTARVQCNGISPNQYYVKCLKYRGDVLHGILTVTSWKCVGDYYQSTFKGYSQIECILKYVVIIIHKECIFPWLNKFSVD